MALDQQKKMLAALSRKEEEDALVSAARNGDSDVKVTKRGGAKGRPPPQLIEGSIYDHPMYYDWAFGFRDYEAEVDFLFDLYEELTGDEPESFVELGCGPAQHSLDMAESNLDVYCIDNNQNMLDYAAQLASGDNLKLTCLNQDMRTFQLPDDKQVQLAACLLGTFQHMYTNEDALATLRAVKRALTPGGLFIIELNHPSLLFDGSVTSSADVFSVDIEPAQVEVFWGQEGDRFDPITQVLDKTVEINIMMRGGERVRLVEQVPMRQFTYQEMSLLAAAAGLEVVAAYGEFDLDSKLGASPAVAPDNNKRPKSAPSADDDDDGDPYRLFVVLRKGT